ncbi:hypothetical protein GQ55_5G044600 [Panicum hallii var. hallii]|jgi:hypothetical protein|uniref:Bifunctional inhibitor/plant lipid transfer protein/seed storage helical domain-containing protein n=1 Tax=Panicum hallii var. hallii TaxID=1504633 RepID=A0A2T7DCN7_9POAL|nr:hypothetical protein GQ55_5G044600 [Panicum hallii var. hallii]
MAAAGTGRKQQLAVAVVALVAMLLVAAATAQDCGVSGDTLNKCLSYCAYGGNANANACCGPLRNANFDCVCRNYWGKLQSNRYYANCANKIKSRCGINRSC